MPQASAWDVLTKPNLKIGSPPFGIPHDNVGLIGHAAMYNLCKTKKGGQPKLVWAGGWIFKHAQTKFERATHFIRMVKK